LRDKGVDARGLEIDGRTSPRAIARGLSVIQGDADTDLADYPDASFDYAILSQTLQTTRRPDLVIDQLLRIGRARSCRSPISRSGASVSSLVWGGRMPVTRQLPVAGTTRPISTM
jgi:methionine biosynthesis protein MetW